MKHGWTLVALLLGGTIAMSAAHAQAQAKTEGGADAIRPFTVHVPDEALTDLKRRVAATRWPARETVTDQSQGVPLATVQQLARYWGFLYQSSPGAGTRLHRHLCENHHFRTKITR